MATTTMTTATANFAGIPDLLFCLAEVVQSRKELAKLRLVNKAFSTAATTILFRDFCITITDIDVVSPAETSAYLGHVRKLSFTSAVSWQFKLNVQNERLQHMVQSMPKMETFQ